MKKKKPSGYFWCFRKILIQKGVLIPFWIKDFSTANNTKLVWTIDKDKIVNLSNKQIKYFVRNILNFRKLFFFTLFLITNLFAFQGVGDCPKLLTDYAQLTGKSVFLPSGLMGSCVVQSEKHFPMILKNAGYVYKEKNGFLDVHEIPIPKEKPLESWKPTDKYFDVSFIFLNVSSTLDCGLKMDDIIASSHNLDYSFSLGLSLGCPALDYDGSFAFRTNVHLIDVWEYSHGIESTRTKAQITSSTGAVTNQYEYLTTGLMLTLEQKESGIFYKLRYTGSNGSVTTSSGGIIDKITALVTDEYTRTRYFGFIPLGKEKALATYTLVLRIVPAMGQQ